MKILLTMDNYPNAVNGVATSVLTLKKALEKQGHDVRLLVLNNKRKSEKLPGKVYAIGSTTVEKIYPGMRFSIRLDSHLIRELIVWHPDIVHSNTEFATFIMASRIARDCNVPIVHTYHTVYEDYTHYFSPSQRVGKRLIKEFSAAVAKTVDAMVVPTEKIQTMLRGYGIRKALYVIPTGIDLDKFLEPVDMTWIYEQKTKFNIKPKTAIFLGRLAKEKNIGELIEAFKNTKHQLVIVGDGPDRKRLEEMSDGAENIVFTGMVPRTEVQKYYHLGDFFVSASVSETQGLTYYEAMASGLPLLCRYDPCLDNIIDNGVNGYTYTSSDELKDKLNRMESADLNRMSDESIKIVQQFSSDTFGKSVLSVYKKTIENFIERHDGISKIFEINSELFGTYRKIKEMAAVIFR